MPNADDGRTLRKKKGPASPPGPSVSISFRLLVAAAEQAQEEQEHVYEIEIELERAVDRRLLLVDASRDREIRALDALRVIGGEACEDQHAEPADHQLHPRIPQE